MNAEQILARLLETEIEPIYLINPGGGGPMRACWFCHRVQTFNNAIDFRNHFDGCPWWAAREWRKKQRKTGSRAKAGAQVIGGRNPHDQLAPTPRRTTPAFADGPVNRDEAPTTGAATCP